MIAKLILAMAMAASAFLGGAGTFDREEVASFDGYYLYVDELGQPSLWLETNGLDGLQTTPRKFEGGAFKVEIPNDERFLL